MKYKKITGDIKKYNGKVVYLLVNKKYEEFFVHIDRGVCHFLLRAISANSISRPIIINKMIHTTYFPYAIVGEQKDYVFYELVLSEKIKGEFLATSLEGEPKIIDVKGVEKGMLITEDEKISILSLGSLRQLYKSPVPISQIIARLRTIPVVIVTNKGVAHNVSLTFSYEKSPFAVQTAKGITIPETDIAAIYLLNENDFNKEPFVISRGFLTKEGWIEKGTKIPCEDIRSMYNGYQFAYKGNIFCHENISFYEGDTTGILKIDKAYLQNTVAKTAKHIRWCTYGCCDDIKNQGKIELFIPNDWLSKKNKEILPTYLDDINTMYGKKVISYNEGDNTLTDCPNVAYVKNGWWIEIDVPSSHSYFILILVRYLWFYAYSKIPLTAYSLYKDGKTFFQALVEAACKHSDMVEWSFINSSVSASITKTATIEKYLQVLTDWWSGYKTERYDELINKCK